MFPREMDPPLWRQQMTMKIRMLPGVKPRKRAASPFVLVPGEAFGTPHRSFLSNLRMQLGQMSKRNLMAVCHWEKTKPPGIDHVGGTPPTRSQPRSSA